MNKRTCSRILLVISLLVIVLPSSAQDDPYRQSLVGLKGVEVIVDVENTNTELEHDGLSQMQVTTDVELRLRKAGIIILEKFKNPRAAFLYVNIHVMFPFPNKTHGVYAITVGVNQLATLDRNPRLTVTVDTWHKSGLGTIGNAGSRELRNYVLDLVDTFINAYLAANSK